MLVCGQATVNIAAVMGLAPLTGIPLPFLSYGGSSLVVLLASVGILLNIAARGHAETASVRDRSRGDGRTRAAGARSGGRADGTGVYVTLAGSPDRAEAQLVPEAGYELDTFRITGFPRQPSPRSCRPCTGPAPRRGRAARSSAAAGPTSSSEAAGYVAGPMVFAAATMRIPAALSEADAHLGLANRIALAFAKQVFLAYPLEGRNGPRFRVVGRPIPAPRAPIPQSEAREIFELPSDGPVLLVAGALAGARSLNETIIEAFGELGPSILHITGERDYWSLKHG